MGLPGSILRSTGSHPTVLVGPRGAKGHVAGGERRQLHPSLAAEGYQVHNHLASLPRFLTEEQGISTQTNLAEKPSTQGQTFRSLKIN